MQNRLVLWRNNCFSTLVKTIKKKKAPTLRDTQTSLNVALVGSPNAGKSLILNRFLDNNVSAVSPKVNTTRSAIHGVKSCARTATQLVFVDLPGFVENTPDNKKLFVSPLRKTVEDALVTEQLDAIMLVVDAAKSTRLFQWAVVDRLTRVLKSTAGRGTPVPCFLILNKVDLLRGSKRGQQQQKWMTAFVEKLQQRAAESFPSSPTVDDSASARGFQATHYVSAKKRWGLKELEAELCQHAVPREWVYGIEDVTSLSLEERVGELVRGHLYRRLNSEVPYQTRQQMLEAMDMPDGTLLVRHQIHVGSKSHTRIVRSALAFIQRAAMQDLQTSLGRKVELLISVKQKRV